METMHPVQEHTNTLGIDCSEQRPTEYIYKYERNSIPTQSVSGLGVCLECKRSWVLFHEFLQIPWFFFCWIICCAGFDWCCISLFVTIWVEILFLSYLFCYFERTVLGQALRKVSQSHTKLLDNFPLIFAGAYPGSHRPGGPVSQ